MGCIPRYKLKTAEKIEMHDQIAQVSEDQAVDLKFALLKIRIKNLRDKKLG